MKAFQKISALVGVVSVVLTQNTSALGAISDLFWYEPAPTDQYFLMGSGIQQNSIPLDRLNDNARFWTSTDYTTFFKTTRSNVTVGIGTTNIPQARLEVAVSGATNQDRLAIYQPDGQDNAVILQTLLDGNSLSSYQTSLYGGNMSNKLILQPIVGNVGIGTNAPSEKLDVNGNIHLPMNNALKWDGNTDWGFIRFSSTGDAPGQSFLEIASGDNSDEPILFSQYDVPGNRLERMRIHTNGNIGIGTNAPSSKLEVNNGASSGPAISINGTNNDGGNITFYNGTARRFNIDQLGTTPRLRFFSEDTNGANGTELMAIQNDGKVGIGTTAPATKLSVNGEISSTLNGGYSQFRAVAGNYGAMFRNDGSDTYFLLTNSGDQYGSWNNLRPLAINNASGNVLVGTNLTVADNAWFNNNVILNWSNSWIMHTPDDGRTQMFITPGTNGGSWDWSTGVVITNNGRLIAKHGGVNENSKPSGWGGGLESWDVWAAASIGAGIEGAGPKAYMNSSGNGYFGGAGVKTTCVGNCF